MQLLASRAYPFLDSQTLLERQARDTLFRIAENEFLLHMTSEVALKKTGWLGSIAGQPCFGSINRRETTGWIGNEIHSLEAR